MGFATRKIANKMKPTQVISVEQDLWTIKSLGTFKHVELSFRLGEEFEEFTPDGKVFKVG